jgi:hypothetical protein
MEDRFKERVSAALLGDLLLELAKREKIKKLLGEMDGWSADELISDILDGLEKLIEQRYEQYRSEHPPTEESEESQPTTPDEPATPPEPHAGPELMKPLSFSELFAREWEASVSDTSEEPAKPAVPPDAVLSGTEGSSPLASGSPESESPSEVSPENLEAPQEAQPEKPLSTKLRELDDTDSLVHPPETETGLPAEESPDETPPAPKVSHPRVHFEFGEDDHVYIHGIAMISPDEPQSSKPFMLEEKGIDDRDFAFALDHRGLRFYLSKIHTRSSNVSKAGILLMNKQESIMMRGRHESILNELRAHGAMLPVEFGTVARGKEELLQKIDSHLSDLHLAVEDIARTTWWDVSVFALDTRAVKGLAPESSPRQGRERSRPSYSSSTTAGRSDVKTLDRILSKQKKIAEELHEELSAKAERSDVDMMISLGGGTSEDWKLILKASYEVTPSQLPAFNRVVTDIQYRHFPFDLMLAVAGEREPFSFQD